MNSSNVVDEDDNLDADQHGEKTEKNIDSVSGVAEGDHKKTKKAGSSSMKATDMDFILNIPLPSAVCVVARRNTGKSFLICSWIYEQLKRGRLLKQNIIVFTSTSFNDQYDFLPAQNVRPYSETLVKKIIQFQKRRLLLLKKRSDRSGVPVQIPGICLVLDDVQTYSGRASDGSKGHFLSECLKFLFTTGRHLKIQLWCATQATKTLISPACRSNCDVLAMSSLTTEQMRACYQLISDVTFPEFKRMIDNLPCHVFAVYNTYKPPGERWGFVKATGYAGGKFLIKFDKPAANKQPAASKQAGKQSGAQSKREATAR